MDSFLLDRRKFCITREAPGRLRCAVNEFIDKGAANSKGAGRCRISSLEAGNGLCILFEIDLGSVLHLRTSICFNSDQADLYKAATARRASADFFDRVTSHLNATSCLGLGPA